MTKRKKLTIALLSLISSHAFAACMQIPCGWYIEGNVGGTKISNLNYGAGTSFNSSGSGANVNIGYKFMPFFAWEVGYTRYSNMKINFAGTQVATNKTFAVDVAGKGLLPIAETGAGLFAKIGYARVNSKLSISKTIAGVPADVATSTTQTANSYYIGFGADYALTPSIPVNVQWARAKGNRQTGTFDLYSAGIAYIFG